MKFYRVNAAVPFLVTSKAEAKREARRWDATWQPTNIPTSKAALLEWANDVLTSHEAQLVLVRSEVKEAVADFYSVVKRDNKERILKAELAELLPRSKFKSVGLTPAKKPKISKQTIQIMEDHFRKIIREEIKRPLP